jgi:hypothetical protein
MYNEGKIIQIKGYLRMFGPNRKCIRVKYANEVEGYFKIINFINSFIGRPFYFGISSLFARFKVYLGEYYFNKSLLLFYQFLCFYLWNCIFILFWSKSKCANSILYGI